MIRRSWSKRVVSMILALLMAISVIAGSTVSVIGETVDEIEVTTTDYYSVTYGDGIINVALDAKKIGTLLKTRSLTRADIRAMIPDEFTQVIEKHNLKSLLDLAATYAERNVVSYETLIDIIPEEVLFDYIDLDVIDAVVPIETIPLEAILQDLLDAGKLDVIIENDTVLEQLFGKSAMDSIMENNAGKVEKLVKDNFNSLYTAHKTQIEVLLTPTVIKSICDADFVKANFGKAYIQKLYNDGALGGVFDIDGVKDLLTPEDKASMDLTPTEAEVIECVLNNHLNEFIDKCDISKLALAIPADDIYDKAPRDEFVTAVGGYGKIIDALGGYVEIVSELGGTAKVVKSLGGLSALIGDVGGLSHVVDVLRNNDLIGLLPLNEIFKHVFTSDIIKGMDPDNLAKELIPVVVNFITSEIGYVKLNGVDVYSDLYVHLNGLKTAFLNAIPDETVLKTVASGDKVFSLIFTMQVRDTETCFGIEFTLVGDTSDINEEADKIIDAFDYTIDGDNLDIVSNVPDTVINLYKRSLESNRVSAEIKDRLLSLLDGDGYGLIDYLNSVTEARVQAVIDNVTGGTAYPVAEVLIKVLREIADEMSKLPEERLKQKLVDFYNGNGNFKYEGDFTYNTADLLNKLFDKLESRIPVAVYLRDFFKNETLTEHVSADITFDGIYKATFHVKGKKIFNVFLPAGTKLDLALGSSALSGYGAIGWKLVDGTQITAATVMPEGDIDVYEAQVGVHTIGFYADNQLIKSVLYAEGTKPGEIELPEIPDKIGFTAAWPAFELGDMDVRVDAVYTRKEYTITYNTDGGTEIPTETHKFGYVIFPPANPTKTGYRFVGWDKEFPAKMPAENLTFTAIWEKNSYTITFNTDGGSTIPAAVYKYGDSVTAPGNPTKTGHTFKGWDKQFPETMPAEDLTFTAKWEANSYTVTFNSNGGSAVASATYKFGEKITVSEKPVKTGYTFRGWEGLPETMPAENITVTAKWEINPYVIVFDTDGGTTIATAIYKYGEKITPPEAPTKAGYTFKGWDKALPETMPAEDLNFKAVWEVNSYTITYNTNGGSLIAPATYKFGEKTEAPADPIREGYTFKGWDKAIPATMPSENIELNAVWEVVEYTVSFVVDGRVIGEYTFNIENMSVFTFPEIPAKEHYTAVWETGTLTLANLNIKAVYTPIDYTATFIVDGKTYARVTYTIENINLVEFIEVPAKEGYSGAWEVTALPLANIDINAVYTPIDYTATFVADGKTVAEIKFNIENRNITEPKVPEKSGYTGKWEAYELGNENITINAVYTRSLGFLWIWIIIIILLAVLIWLIVFIIKKKKKSEKKPEEKKEKVVPQRTGDSTVKEDPKKVDFVPVKTVKAEEVDEMMSDSDAISLVEHENGESDKTKKGIINIDVLDMYFNDGERVTLDDMKVRVPGFDKSMTYVKVLANGKIEKKLTVIADDFSVQAIKMIVLTGGKAISKK